MIKNIEFTFLIVNLKPDLDQEEINYIRDLHSL